MAKISARNDSPLHKLERVTKDSEGNDLVRHLVFTRQGRVLRKVKYPDGSWSGYKLVKKVPVNEIADRVKRLLDAGCKELKV